MKTEQKARPAKKHLVQTNQEQKNSWDTQKGLTKIEATLTSPIQTKSDLNEPHNSWTTYYLAFFAVEGISQEIPVIFRLFGNFQPGISPQSKVLLTGTWAESNSNRPSFTCTEYQILAGPPKPTIKTLWEQLNSLISISLKKLDEWKQRVGFLIDKKNDLGKIEKLTQLGEDYLKAYLLLKSASYARYQDNLLSHTTELKDFDNYLAKLASEIEEQAQHIRAYQSKDIANHSLEEWKEVFSTK